MAKSWPPFRHPATAANGGGGVLVVERLLGGARQRGVCKERAATTEARPIATLSVRREAPLHPNAS